MVTPVPMNGDVYLQSLKTNGDFDYHKMLACLWEMDDYQKQGWLNDHTVDTSDIGVTSTIRHEVFNNDDIGKMFRYKINSDGHVGEEFVHNPDIIAMGCSVTYGAGMHTEFAWPNIVREATGKTVNVLAFPGASIMSLTQHLYRHVAQYGWPKQIMFLIPDLWRTEPQVQCISRDGQYRNVDGKEMRINDSFSKKNLRYSAERTLRLSMLALLNLQNICKSLNIDYKTFSWHRETHYVLKTSEYSSYLSALEHFVPPNSDAPGQKWGVPIEMFHTGTDMCPCGLQPGTPTQQDMWNIALDIGEHPGMHLNIHFAEIFINAQIEQNVIDKIKPFHNLYTPQGVDAIKRLRTKNHSSREFMRAIKKENGEWITDEYADPVPQN